VKEIADKLLQQVQLANNIAITTHVNPDGDGFCAAMALQRILSALYKESVIITDDDDLSRYEFLMKEAPDKVNIRRFKTLTEDERTRYDLVFVLDCNSFDRIKERKVLLQHANQIVLLDHHEIEHDPIQANLSYIDTSYVSAGAIVFDLLKPFIVNMPSVDRLYVANCIYVTVLNDTNNFANANTNSAVFTLAAELSDLGISVHRLNKDFLHNHSAEEMRYVGETLATIKLHNQRRILTMYSSLDMMQRNQLDPDSVMNITRWVQGVKGLKAILYMREDAPGLFKLSLRSVTLNVNKIAIKYGGGGHQQASGCTIYGQLEDIEAMLLRDISAALLEYDA
jgi:phosphoesterase RecJ-like protein